MSIPEFPPNSKASKQGAGEKRVVKAVQGEVIRQKKPLRRQFRETFIAGDLRTSVLYGLLEIGMPMVRDAVWEAFSEGLYKLFHGEGRRRGASPPAYAPTGTVQYNRYSMGSPQNPGAQRAMNRQARARHDFDAIVLETRADAEEVIERLFDVVSRYETATVADLYELVGVAASHADHKWGWTDVRGAGVSRTRDGYLLDLPEPHPI